MFSLKVKSCTFDVPVFTLDTPSAADEIPSYTGGYWGFLLAELHICFHERERERERERGIPNLVFISMSLLTVPSLWDHVLQLDENSFFI
jgi:hypothetical protein